MQLNWPDKLKPFSKNTDNMKIPEKRNKCFHQGRCIKDTWTKPKGVGLRVEGGDGVGGCSGVKMETTVLEQELKKRKQEILS